VPDSAPTSALPPGSYEFTTQYSGDANFSPSAGPPEPLTVTDTSGGGAIIVPPGTPCSQVTYDLAHGLRGQSKVTVDARVAAGVITRRVAPPYVTYYVKLFAPSSSFQIDVNQTPPTPLSPLFALQGHVTLHNGSAKLMALPHGSVTITSTNVEIDVNRLTPGADYYIGIRYRTNNLVGERWPFGTNATVDDVFKTMISAGGLVPNSTVNLPIQSSDDGFAPARSPQIVGARARFAAGAFARAHVSSGTSRSADTPVLTIAPRRVRPRFQRIIH
jgi:hypothetical protein